MRSRRVALVLAAVAAALGLAALSASASGSAGGSGPGNRGLARLDAAQLLLRARLPAGATPSAGEPAGDGGDLSRPAVGLTGNVVDRHQWWVVPGSAAGVDAFVRGDPPAGGRLSESGSASTAGGAPSLLFEGFEWPALRGRLSTRQLIIAIAPLAGGGSGVRVDTQSVWITPRPASERIPRRVARLEVALLRFSKPIAGPFTFAARRRIRRVRGLINALPAAQPGAQACPADGGYDVRLTFMTASRRTLAVVNADPQGCQGVQMTLRGKTQPPLTSEGFPGSGRSPRRPLVDQLDRMLGLRLTAKLAP